MAFAPASLYWCRACKVGSSASRALRKKSRGKNSLGGTMRHLILAAVSVAALALAGPASADSPIVIKFSHLVASNTPKGAAAEKFKELAEKYTDGKDKVELYPNSALYNEKEQREAPQLVSVQRPAQS